MILNGTNLSKIRSCLTSKHFRDDIIVAIIVGIIGSVIFTYCLQPIISPPRPKLEIVLNPVQGEIRRQTSGNYLWAIPENITQIRLMLVFYNVGDKTAEDVQVRWEWAQVINISLIQIPILEEGQIYFGNVSGTYTRTIKSSSTLQNLTLLKLQTLTSYSTYTIEKVVTKFWTSLVIPLEVRSRTFFKDDYPSLLITISYKEQEPIKIRILITHSALE